jgi:tetratricopeptide (TPR) repeat protein
MMTCKAPGRLQVRLRVTGCGMKRPVVWLYCAALMMGTGVMAQMTAAQSGKIADELEQIRVGEHRQSTPQQLGVLWSMVAIDYQEAMEFSQAEDAYGRSLVLLARIPAAVRAYAATLDNLGALYMVTGRLDEAETCRKKALVERQRLGNALDVALSHELGAQVSLLRRRFKEAEREAAEALRVLDADPAANKFAVVSTLMTLVYARCLQNDCSNGDKDGDRAVMLARREFGPDSLVWGQALMAHGFAKGKMGEMQEAEKMMLQGIQTIKAHLPSRDPRVVGGLLQYRDFLAGAHRKAEAKQVEREVADLKSQHPSCNGCTVSVYALSASSRR